MKFFKKNQVIIYATCLMLIVAGYLNFTSNIGKNAELLTSSTDLLNTNTVNENSTNIISNDDTANENNINKNIEFSSIMKIAKDSENNSDVNSENSKETSTDENIGDAQLVSSNDVKEVKAEENEYYSNSKLERDSMYSQMLETYQNILNSSNSSDEQKKSATDEITKINHIKNSIMICENLITTKGFEDCVVFVNEKSISCIIKKKELSNQEVAQIQNIVSREMNAKIENIHISCKIT